MAYLAVPQQFENSPLIWGESNNFADNRLDKLVFFGGLPFAVRGFWCSGDRGHAVALVQPNTAVCKVEEKGDRDQLCLYGLAADDRTDCCGELGPF